MNLNILKLLLSLVKYNTICKHSHKYFLITTKQQKPLMRYIRFRQNLSLKLL